MDLEETAGPDARFLFAAALEIRVLDGAVLVDGVRVQIFEKSPILSAGVDLRKCFRGVLIINGTARRHIIDRIHQPVRGHSDKVAYA